MEFRVLGPIEAWRDGVLLDLGKPQQRAVLAVLLLHPNQVVGTEQLIDVLWNGHPPDSARHAIYVQVSALRTVLGSELIDTCQPGYRLQVEPDQVDSHRFERLVKEGRRASRAQDFEQASSLLTEALTLWRGDPVADLTDFSQLEQFTSHLEEMRLSALEESLDADLALGRHAAVLPELKTLVAQHPFREHLTGQLMLALYRSHRRVDALRVYREAHRHLTDELGVEPGHELRRLEEQILLEDPDLGPPLRSRYMTPVPVSALLGREAEVAACQEMLENARLVTITGVGGVGKTRLAQHVAERVGQHYRDGVAWVELGDISRSGLVMGQVAGALRVREDPELSLQQRLVEFLKPRRLLLVLDNCEHLLPDIGHLAHRLLRASPGLRILTTSRQRLGFPGEKVLPLGPLPVPPPGESKSEVITEFDAVRLLCTRATEINPSFSLDASNCEAVARICRRLEGIPLAIELAAARLHAIEPGEAARLLDKRQEFLSDPNGHTHDRHRSLSAALEWSYVLLSPAEKRLFRRCSVFRGGFTLEALSGMWGEEQEIEELLANLVTKSTVTAVVEASDARYRLLEPVRSFAWNRLVEAGETEEALVRHEEWFTEFAERAVHYLHTPDQPEWIARVENEENNLRSVLERSVREEKWDSGFRVASALAMFWIFRSRLDEAKGWFEELLDVSGVGSPHLRARALILGSLIAVRAGDPALAERWLVEGDDLGRQLRSTTLRIWTRAYQALVALSDRRPEHARALAHEAGAYFALRGRVLGIAVARLMEGLACFELSLVPEKEEVWKEVLQIVQEGLDAANQTGDANLVGHLLYLRAMAWNSGGDLERASRDAFESIELFRGIGSLACAGHCIDVLADLLERSGLTWDAARLVVLSESLRKATGRSFEGPWEKNHWNRIVDRCRDRLEEAQLEQAERAGNQMSVVEASEHTRRRLARVGLKPDLESGEGTTGEGTTHDTPSGTAHAGVGKVVNTQTGK